MKLFKRKNNRKKLNKKIHIFAGIIGLALFSVTTTLLFFYKPQQTEAAWWESTWKYRKRIRLTYSGSENLDDYQVELTNINTSTLISAGKLQSDCDDLRFAGADGIKYDYWIEDGCNTTSTTIWVKVSNFSAGMNKDIYMYYGNPSATEGSNGDDTFVLFDDFEDEDTGNVPDPNKWYLSAGDAGDSITVETFDSGKRLKVYETGNSGVATNYKNTYSVEDYFDAGFYKLHYGVYYDTMYEASNSTAAYQSIPSANEVSYVTLRVLPYTASNPGALQWYNGSSYQATGKNYSRDTWYEVDLEFQSLTTTKLFVDNTEYTIGHRNTPSIGLGRVGLPYNSPRYENILYIDDVYLAKYVDNEPTYSSISSEEVSKEPILHLSFDEGYGDTVYNRAGAQPKRDPVAYWKMDETSGTTVYDQTQNNLDGTMVSMNDSDHVSGKHGYSLDFEQDNTYVNVADNDHLDPVNNDMTFSAWINTAYAEGDAQQSILDKGGSADSDNGYRLLIYSSKYYLFWSDGTTRVLADSGITVNYGNWEHVVAVVHLGSHIDFYVNGERSKTNIDISSLSGFNDTGNLRIGNYRSSASRGVNGQLDEIKIYDYALNEEEIEYEYMHTNGMMINMTEGDWVEGVNGMALDFDGSNDYSVIGDSSSFDITNTGLTYSAWINGDNWDETYNMFMGQVLPYFNVRNTGVLHFSMKIAGTQRSVSGTTVLNTGTWYHAVATYDGTNMRLYLNGKLEATSPNYTGFVSTDNVNSDLYIGKWQSNTTYPFTGQIDELKIYPYARTAGEIKSDYNSYRNIIGTSVGHGGQTPSQPSSEEPILWYDFNQDTGTSVYDRSGNGNHGIMTNMDDKTDYVPGKYGKSLSFDGSNDYLPTPYGSGRNLSTDPVTISMWVKPITNPMYASRIQMFFASSTGTNQRFYFGIYSDLWDMGIQSSGWNAGNAVTPVVYNEWSHIAIVADGSKVKLYVNGVYSFEKSYTSYSLASDFYIARYGGSSSYYFEGEIDEVKIYDYARTVDQIHEDMNGSPIAYWSFDEGYGTTAHDSMENYDGTMTNMDASADWVEGKFNKALSFDGTTTQYIDFSDISGNMNNFSLSAWVKVSSGGDSRKSILRNFWEVVDQDICFWSYNFYDDYWRCSTSNAVPNDTWVHIVTTWNGTVIRHYANGELVWTDSTASGGTNDTFYQIAGYSGRQYKGLLDEMKIYNYTLSDDEVKKEYNSPGGNPSFDGTSVVYGAGGPDELGFSMPDPIAHWNFDEGSGTSLQDVSNNENTGTLTDMETEDWIIGKYGKALKFETNDWVNLGSIGDPSEGSISFWFNKPYIDSGAQYLMDGRDTGNWWLLQDYASGVCTDTTGNICFNGILEIPSSYLSVDTWHNVIITLGTTESAIYLDGNLINTGTSFDPNFNSMRLATRYTLSSWYSGQLDEIKIFDESLTPAQVAWEYNRGKPIFHMKFDQDEFIDCNGSGSGTANVCESIGYYHGTAYGSMTTSDWVTGKFQNALEFDGTDDYIAFNSAVTTGPNEGSVSFWVKTDNASRTCILSRSTGGYSGQIELVPSSNTIRLESFTNNAWQISIATGINVDDNNWHHYEVIYTSLDTKLYVDGELANTGTANTDTANWSWQYIGAAQATGYGVNYIGQLDDIRIYNYIRTADQIKQDYNGSAVNFQN